MFTSNFWQDVLDSYTIFGIIIAILLVVYGANICFSLYYNIAVFKDAFSPKKLAKGLIKIGVLIIGLALIAFVLVAIPAFFVYIGIDIPEEYITTYNVIAIAAVFMSSIKKYVVEAVEKAKKIIDDFNPFSEKGDENKTADEFAEHMIGDMPAINPEAAPDQPTFEEPEA